MLTRTVHAPTTPVLLGLFIVRVAEAVWHCDTDWDRLQLFDHGAFLSTCRGIDGKYCAVECDAGYVATKSWSLDNYTNAYWCHCDSATKCIWKDGNVARDLVCQPTECLSDQPVPDATRCKHRQLGEECEVECNAGYVANAGGLRQYTCAATGEWEGGSLVCTKTPNLCPEVLTNQHAKFDPETCKRTVDDFCTADCELGFEPAEGAGANVYKCGADGLWRATVSPPLRCERRCQNTVPAQHAFFTPCERTPGSSCEARCVSGYSSEGESVYKCGNNGQWAGGQLTCTLTGCGDELPPVTEHAHACPPAALNGKCTPPCAPGYTPSNATPYSCTRVHDGKTAEWIGGSLSCAISSNWCAGALPSLASENINVSRCVQTVGTECNARCANGSHSITGTDHATYACSSDSLGDPQWLPKIASDLLVCKKKCQLQVPSLHPDRAQFQTCEGLPGSRCKAECKHPFVQRSGDHDFACQNGEWQGAKLLCELPCRPGTVPAVYNASTRDAIHCAPCGDGKFSSAKNDGLQCEDCPGPNANKTLCERCPEGQGPNRDKTVCQVCRDLNRNLVSQNGVCQPERDDLSKEIRNLWDTSDILGKVLAIAGLVLVIALLLCCCSRKLANDTENRFYYIANLIAAIVALVFLFVNIALASDEWGWERACAATTAATWLPVPHIIRRYERSLARLEDPRSDPRLSEDRTWTGPFGLLLFVYGLADVVIDAWFCVKMWACGQTVLFVCGTATMIVTTMMTWYLGYRTLRSIVEHDQRDGKPAATWLSNHELAGPIVVLASSSRLNSMAILRLKIGKWKILDFDDSNNQRYFHFMRNSGMFHYLVEDIPHAMTSLAVISAGHTMGCGADEHPTIAKLSLVLSLGSILIGIISKTIQQLTIAITDVPAPQRHLLPVPDGTRMTM